jgi:hypothetical protein
MGITPLIYIEATIHIAEFPATISPLLGETTTDEFHIFTEKLTSDALLPFVETNSNMMSARKPHSPYQEFHGVASSSRRIILSSKLEMRGVIGQITLDPIEQHLGALLGHPRGSLGRVEASCCPAVRSRRCPFRRSACAESIDQREVLEWIGENWDALRETFTTVAANQRTVSGRPRG